MLQCSIAQVHYHIECCTDLVVHLFRAVEHIDHGPQGPPKVFGGFSLAGAGWSCGGSTHGQVEGLGEGDVAPGVWCISVYIKCVV